MHAQGFLADAAKIEPLFLGAPQCGGDVDADLGLGRCAKAGGKEGVLAMPRRRGRQAAVEQLPREIGRQPHHRAPVVISVRYSSPSAPISVPTPSGTITVT